MAIDRQFLLSAQVSNTDKSVWRWFLDLYDSSVVNGASITTAAITGTGATLAIAGFASTTGGAITVTGGASSTSATAGGAVTLAGGAGGATGAGGAVNLTGAAGGGTSGTGGAVAITAGAGTAGNANGGSVSVTPGAKQGTGVDGLIREVGTVAKKVTVTAMTTSATITVAALRGGLITANQGAAGAATYTMPTGAVFDAAMPADFAVGDAVDFSITNISTVAAEDVTMAGAAGMVAKGNLFVPSNAATSDVAFATFRIVKEGANTFSFYRIG